MLYYDFSLQSVSLNMRGGQFHLFAESRERCQGENFSSKFKTIGHEEYANFKYMRKYILVQFKIRMQKKISFNRI